MLEWQLLWLVLLSRSRKAEQRCILWNAGSLLGWKLGKPTLVASFFLLPSPEMETPFILPLQPLGFSCLLTQAVPGEAQVGHQEEFLHGREGSAASCQLCQLRQGLLGLWALSLPRNPQDPAVPQGNIYCSEYLL